MLQTIRNILLDILFPPLCLICNAYLEKTDKHKSVCAGCFNAIPIYDSVFCPVCFSRIPEKAHCHKNAHYVLAPVSHYDNEIIKKIIWQFKYEGWLSLSEPLFNLTSIYLKKVNADWKTFSIIYVPLHKKREMQRGFNQSAVLAKLISQNLGLEIIQNNLVRIKNTHPQAEVNNYSDREKNIENAFFMNYPEQLKNKNVLLVDDVFTSGATLNEAARTLKSAGAKKIIALVIARAR